MNENTIYISERAHYIREFIYEQNAIAKCEYDIALWSSKFRVASGAIQRLSGFCETEFDHSIIKGLWNYLYHYDRRFKNFINNYGEVVRR